MLKKTPASHVIDLFGGVRAASRLLGRTPGAVSKWKERGRIPAVLHKKVLRIARRKKLKIKASDIII